MAPRSLLCLRNSDLILILSFLDIKSIKLAQATCHELEFWGRHVVNERYDRILLRYISSPDAFRRLLDSKRAIIGGSSALEFFLGDVDWVSNDLDVFLRPSYLPDFLDFFHEEGYKRVFPWQEDVLPARQIPCVEASLKLRKGKRTVDLMITSFGNAFEGIVHSWSTLLVNAMSGSNAVCAYPHLTMNHTAVLSTPKTIALRHLPYAGDTSKYEARSFTFSLPPAQQSPATPLIARYIPDKHCLFLRFYPRQRREDNRPFTARWLSDHEHVAMSAVWYDDEQVLWYRPHLLNAN
ncbi:hypothetical protein NLI96_g11970 [Meripilus lineatus]|uniref:Uncharacterized protein n=1 Tax=Meripilus lineatus TaxID=2056292 RepID=A0AAD5YAC8_9APHY|nr:hypothetical protein NLI96_g11970 [Physisporinus lineatus]